MLDLDARRSALLVMDFQATIVQNYALDWESLLARTSSLLAAARAAGMAVIYVGVGFRPGFPEVSPNNKSFSAIKQSDRFKPADFAEPEKSFHESVAPLPGDIIVVKHRVSAFFGTDLDMILRAKSIDTLVLSGIATSGVVLSTLRHAADGDYRCVVVEDGCADLDPEVHAVLCGKVFARQATVVKAVDVTEALAQPALSS